MMYDISLYSFISIASTALIEHISYNRILNLFYFSHAPSPFARKTKTQREPISKNYASA